MTRVVEPNEKLGDECQISTFLFSPIVVHHMHFNESNPNTFKY